MTRLDPKDGHMVLINTFRVKPGRAEDLLKLLAEATENGIRRAAGFVSANVHVSLDGTKVVNYAQWRSKEDFEAFRTSDSFKAHVKPMEELIEGFDPQLYELRYSHSAESVNANP